MEEDEESTASTQSATKTGRDTVSDGPCKKPRFAGFYREDVVQSAAQPGVMGMVTKVGGDSDSDSSSNSETEEDDAEALSEGFAHICWTNLEESTEKIEEIWVADRTFIHGDIVAAVSSPSSQTGTVVNVHLRVDLELPSGEILKDVDSKKIKRVRDFIVGDHVVHDHWLGRVEEVVDNVTVMFDDGATCKVVRADPLRLTPISVSAFVDSDCPYYPGQRVRACSSALFKTARWLKGTWKSNRMEGTVTDVEVGSVLVYWIAAAYTGYTSQAGGGVPPVQQDQKHLKRMPDLSCSSWQLGDRALLSQRLATKGLMAPPVHVDATHPACQTEMVEGLGQNHVVEPSDAGTNSFLGSKDGALDSWVAYRRKLKRRFSKPKKKVQKKDELVETALLIVGTKRTVDVLWQDSTLEKGLDACKLSPVDHLGDHDFWPEQHVMERSSDLEGSNSDMKRVGIVKSVDSKQRTATVRWLLQTDHPEEGHRFESEDTVSVYELVEHPDYSYCLGDVVIRLCATVDSPTKSSTAPMLEESEAVLSIDGKSEEDGTSSTPPTTAHVKQSVNKANSKDLSWVGVITGLQDGDIEVAWANGEVSKVGPYAIFVVGRDENDGSSEIGENDGSSEIGDIENAQEADDAGSWTTVESTEITEVGAGEQELDQSVWDESDAWEGPKEAGEIHNPAEIQRQTSRHGQSAEDVSHILGSALSLPFTVLIRALKFAAGFLWTLSIFKRNLGAGQQLGTSGFQNQTVHKPGFDIQLVEAGISLALSSDSSQILKTHITGQMDVSSMLNPARVPGADKGHSDEIVSQQDAAANKLSYNEELEAVSKDSCEHQDKSSSKVGERSVSGLESKEVVQGLSVFEKFDSVKDSADHHFTSETGQPSSQRQWSKKIQQEWLMLEKDLPGTIFVRVYEDRMDLMRAVIIGAAGTPYHDGLFFFDLCMPSEYPSVPPLVHYHSGGLRLNPNLYETGKVCLSLLNTWTGKGSEIWHPSTSSILQVLVSIQGLVLNANPYFNEAGYGKQLGTVEGEKNSLAYSENSFLLSCKLSLYLIRRPPKHFEDFVREHFKLRGPYILKACNAYMQGFPVGSLLNDATVSPLHSRDLEETSSTGFRLMLAKIMPRLVTAFKQVGANCQQYEQLGADCG